MDRDPWEWFTRPEDDSLEFRTFSVDSSPLRGKDFLWLVSWSAKAVDAFLIHDAVCFMERRGTAMPENAEDAAAVKQAHRSLRLVQEHTHPPVFLGARAAGLLPKSSALMHSVMLECGSLRECKGWVAGVISATTDQGTEVNISLLPSDIDVRELLPPWRLHLRDAVFDDVGGGGGSGVGGDAWRNEDVDGRMFSLSVPIAGLLHLLNNLGAEFMTQLELWPSVHQPLSAVARVLGNKDNVTRIVLTCCQGPNAAFAADFEGHRVQSWIRWRWGSVVKVLRPLIALETALRSCFDQGSFLGGGGGGGGNLDDPGVPADFHDPGGDRRAENLKDIAMMDSAVKDPVFWAQVKLLFSLQSCLDEAEGYVSGCPCHGDEFWMQGRNRWSRRSAFSALCGDPDAMTCPMTGCRAPEMATGVFSEVLESRLRRSTSQLVWSILLTWQTPDIRQRLMDDWNVGVGIIRGSIMSKIAYWQELPHILAGLAASRPEDASRCAERALQLYGQLPEALHHFISKLFLSAEEVRSLRVHVQAMAQGTLLRDTPRRFQLWVLRA
eukprot:5529150-Alexandrium_andersonii.AAC.1